MTNINDYRVDHLILLVVGNPLTDHVACRGNNG